MPFQDPYQQAKLAGASEVRSDSAPEASPDFFHKLPMRTILPFINGGIAGIIATTLVQPIDMIKVRLQLSGEASKSGFTTSPISVFRDITSTGKLIDLYTGISAGILRQAVYTTARLGLFDTTVGFLTVKASEQHRSINFKERASAGLMAGGFAAMLGNPADLALIRMQSDSLKPIHERQNHRHALSALKDIARSEGLVALWAGATPTVARAMALNFGQLTFFYEAKHILKDAGLTSQSQTVGALAIAGFFASFFSLPFDFVKTRLQKQVSNEDGKLPYKSMSDCFEKVAREEGILSFYRGFSTYYGRIAPHAIWLEVCRSNVSIDENSTYRITFQPFFQDNIR
ncbi:Bgt-1129 [Blumeria graminis f. sp. tritici]|uniref:Mitochondrial inner membrane transporter n=3 Tax=Blumeria graminis f. sp. tritici TaxID=62690 RepID=A0A656KP43_BLUGR|nr:Mitochondrial inner membrane transporter [Blumeria graminis f. sp. tritici 96224]VDB87904.1 Bgt-1129 [Blumeria graminis f. sp. tritici]